MKTLRNTQQQIVQRLPVSVIIRTVGSLPGDFLVLDDGVHTFRGLPSVPPT